MVISRKSLIGHFKKVPDWSVQGSTWLPVGCSLRCPNDFYSRRLICGPSHSIVKHDRMKMLKRLTQWLMGFPSVAKKVDTSVCTEGRHTSDVGTMTNFFGRESCSYSYDTYSRESYSYEYEPYEYEAPSSIPVVVGNRQYDYQSQPERFDDWRNTW